jgi:hypothetical protein
VFLLPSAARADDDGPTTSVVDRPASTQGTVTKAEAAAGTFLPFSQTGVVDSRRAFAGARAPQRSIKPGDDAPTKERQRSRRDRALANDSRLREVLVVSSNEFDSIARLLLS